MRDTLSLRRITRPVLPPTILHRQTLLASLSEAIIGTSLAPPWCKFVLLCAPAGYGKTTLLADFAQQTAFPCCWYALEESDADKITFLELLVASIRQRFAGFGAKLDAVLAGVISAEADASAAPRHLEAAIDGLVEAIEHEISERFALVLCNYHTVNANPTIQVLVNRLLRRLPPHCVLIVESRAVPSLEVAPLLVRREMFGLNSAKLRFTAEEIRELARLQGSIPPTEEEAAQLVDSFDGWIAGILLGTRLGNVAFLSPSAHPPAGATQDRQHLFAYLVSEVFRREPEVYAFLREASILQQMRPSLCAALLDLPDAAERLHQLEQQGFFVTRSGDGSDVFYTCHPVLRELLSQELRSRHPDRFADLHLRAAHLFAARQEYEQAIYHALEAGAEDVAADLIIQASRSMLFGGHSVTLAHEIDELSTTTLARHPHLLLLRAKVYLMQGEYARVLPLLDDALETLSRRSASIHGDEARALQVGIALCRAAALFHLGEYTRVQDLCQQALSLLREDEAALRAEAHLYLGVCANLQGDFYAGITQLQLALQLWGHDTQALHTAQLHSSLANAYGMVGNHALSEHHRTRAIHCWERLNDEWGKIDNLIGMGVTRQRQGAFAQAEEVLTQTLRAARGATRPYRRGEAYTLVSLGDLYQEQGRFNEALDAFEGGLALARQLADKYLTSYAASALATTYLFLGDPHTALLLVSEMAPESEEGVSTYNTALRELALGTILLFQQRYTEAQKHLTAILTTLEQGGLRREWLQASIRIAACQRAQGARTAALERVNEARSSALRYGYELLLDAELRRFPPLMQLLQEQPEVIEVPARGAQGNGNAGDEAPQQPASIVSTGESRLRVFAFGEPSVYLDQAPVTRWRMARAMELFFFLLDRGKPVRKEQIIAALWPEEIDEHVHQTLRSTIYYLRKAVGEACIVYRGNTYALDLNSLYGEQVWYDVAVFQEHYVWAKEALAAGDDATATRSLQEMVSLYRGDYAQSFYSDWCCIRREELRLAYIAARQQLARLAWQREQLDESIEHWQHLLALDNCMEEAYYGLMRCYVRQGKRGLALRTYQRCLTTLREDLAAPPGQAIQNLYQRIVAAPKNGEGEARAASAPPGNR